MSRNTAKKHVGSASAALALPGLCHLGVGIFTVFTALGCVADSGDPLGPPPVDGAPCALQSQLYAIDDVKLPGSTAEAALFGLDLDGDAEQRPDNSAGVALSWLLGSWNDSGSMLHAQLRAAFEDQRVLWLVEVETCVDDAQEPGDYVRIGVHRGAPSGAAGTADIADASPPAQGWRLQGGVVRARAGEGMVPASALMDFLGLEDQVAWARGDGLAVDLEVATPEALQGRMGLGFDDGLRQVTAAIMSEFYTVKLGEGTSEFAYVLDEDEDGVITPEEFLEAPAVRALLVDDVDLMAEREGQQVFWPRYDGVRDRLSLGLWFHATALD